MSNFRDFFAPASVDQFPVLKADPFLSASFNINIDYSGIGTADIRQVPGFNQDGDWITESSTTLVYYNSSDVLQWTINPSDINASADVYAGMTTSGSLVYVVASDTGTTPETLYTATINSAGTITNLGNQQLTNDVSSQGWGPMFERGNLLLFAASISSNNFTNLVEVDITDGSIVSEDKVSGVPAESLHYVTEAGKLFAFNDNTQESPFFGLTTRTRLRDFTSVETIPEYPISHAWLPKSANYYGRVLNASRGVPREYWGKVIMSGVITSKVNLTQWVDDLFEFTGLNA